MANMDKSLPNEVRNSIEIAGPETAMNEEQVRYSRRAP
jgi:hypothetical protein